MSIYYVSAQGCDTNDGLSPESAWQTIGKMMESVSGGDTIKLRCGDTFYGNIHLPTGISEDEPTVLTSYGEGEKPTVSQYKMPVHGAWERHIDGVWKLDLTDTSKFTGNTKDIDTNVGFMKVNGEYKYRKRFHLADLAYPWDFYCDDQYVYVLSNTRPDEITDDVKIACNIRCISMSSNLKVENIICRGAGAHGISGTSVNCHISNCEFHELGGSRLGGIERRGRFNTVRYGNGVEFWSNSTNGSVENCRFSEIYDVAITIQGNRVVRNWDNMIFRNNVIWNCTQGFEIWASTELDEPVGITNSYLENNVVVDCGYCWGYEARPNKGCSSHLMIYNIGVPLCDITIRNNVFTRAQTSFMYKSGKVTSFPKDCKIYDNVIVRHEGQELGNRAACTYEENMVFEEMILSQNQVFNTPKYRNEN